MGIVGWMAFGFIFGLLSRAVIPKVGRMGFFATTVLSIVGGLLGGGIGAVLGWYSTASPLGLIPAVAGAIVLLSICGRLQSVRLTNQGHLTRHPNDKPDQDRFVA